MKSDKIPKPSHTWNGEKLPDTPSPAWLHSPADEEKKGAPQIQEEVHALGFFIQYSEKWLDDLQHVLKESGMGDVLEHLVVFGRLGQQYSFNPFGCLNHWPPVTEFPLRIIFQPNASKAASAESASVNTRSIEEIQSGIKMRLLPLLDSASYPKLPEPMSRETRLAKAGLPPPFQEQATHTASWRASSFSNCQSDSPGKSKHGQSFC